MKKNCVVKMGSTYPGATNCQTTTYRQADNDKSQGMGIKQDLPRLSTMVKVKGNCKAKISLVEAVMGLDLMLGFILRTSCIPVY